MIFAVILSARLEKNVINVEYGCVTLDAYEEPVIELNYFNEKNMSEMVSVSRIGYPPLYPRNRMLTPSPRERDKLNR